MNTLEVVKDAHWREAYELQKSVDAQDETDDVEIIAAEGTSGELLEDDKCWHAAAIGGMYLASRSARWFGRCREASGTEKRAWVCPLYHDGTQMDFVPNAIQIHPPAPRLHCPQ